MGVWLVDRLCRLLTGGPRRGLVETRLHEAEQKVVGAFAYEQASLVRDRVLTQEQALAAIAERFPRLNRERVRDALARGMFESMW
jgi:hypothetical protein